MDNNQFLDEVHSYLDAAFRDFERYQDITFEVLCEFDNICRNNNIEYFLAYGTLLGAIRDGGQIPWDYDVDVMVRIDDRQKLIDALKEINEHFYYAYLDNTPRYPAYCLRVCKKGHHFNAIHVDVFFIIGCPSEKNERTKFLEKRRLYCRRRIAKNSYYWFSQKDSRLGKALYYYSFLRGCLISKGRLDKSERSVVNAYPLNSTQYCCSLAQEIVSFKVEWFNSTEEIMIRNRAFPIPIGYKKILECLFDSYSEYLPISDRFEEFYKELQIIKKRDC